MNDIFEYIPKGVCSRKFTFNIKDNKIIDFTFVGGCNGNLNGITKLIKGMDIDEVINKLIDTKCGFKDTSCPDQIAKALLEYKKSKSNC